MNHAQEKFQVTLVRHVSGILMTLLNNLQHTNTTSSVCNMLNQVLGHRQLALIRLTLAGVFVAISCKFLLVLGLVCCCCGLLVGRGCVVAMGKWRNRALLQQPHTSSLPKLQQLYLNPSSTKKHSLGLQIQKIIGLGLVECIFLNDISIL